MRTVPRHGNFAGMHWPLWLGCFDCGTASAVIYGTGGGIRSRSNRHQLILKSIPLQEKLFALAEAHLDDADSEVRNLANALFIHCERLFTFLEHEGVEPTNNVVERALRTAAQWRKISFGNRSRNGEIATVRLLTVTQTCKRQQRHVLGYLTDAVRCHRRQAAAPSLLPHPALTT